MGLPKPFFNSFQFKIYYSHSASSKYTALSTTHTFIPLAFETLGAWGEQAKGFVSELGRRISAITGDVRETDYLRQRLSIAIQRGNALSIRGTLGDVGGAEN